MCVNKDDLIFKSFKFGYAYMSGFWCKDQGNKWDTRLNQKPEMCTSQKQDLVENIAPTHIFIKSDNNYI